MLCLLFAGSKKRFEELQQQEEKQQEEKITLDTTLDSSEVELQDIKLRSLDKEKELSEAQKLLNDKIARSFVRTKTTRKSAMKKLKYLQDKETNLSQQLSSDKTSLISTQDQIAKSEEDKFNEEILLEQLQQ